MDYGAHSSVFGTSATPWIASCYVPWRPFFLWQAPISSQKSRFREDRTTLTFEGDIVEQHSYLRLPESRPCNSDVICRPPFGRSRPYSHFSFWRGLSPAGPDGRSSLHRNDRQSQHRLQESRKFRRKGSTDGK